MQQHAAQRLVDKLKSLPPERIREVEAFIDALPQRSKNPPAVRLEQPDFPVIRVGHWPGDLNLRREDLYGDDGR